MIYKLIAGFTYLFIVYISFTMPIGPYEAIYFFEKMGAVHFLMNLFPDYPRVAFLFISTLNIFLFYTLSSYYLQSQKDRVIAVTLFILLPGIISSAILADQSSLGIFATLLFFLSYKKKLIWGQYLSLVLLFIVHQASFLFFFALFIYAVLQKNGKLLAFSLLLFSASLYIYGFDVGGKPSGHFLELFALYSLVFSPFLFLYFLYAIYRNVIDKNMDILLVVTTVSLLMSFLLSFRQYIHIEHFAPFVVVATILMVQTFSKSYHIRLKQFRTKYKIAFFVIFATLLVNSILLLNHKILFDFVEPRKHFAYNFYEGYALAKELHRVGIECINAKSSKLQNQLRYYDINYCSEYLLHSLKQNDAIELNLTYKHIELRQLYVSKVNTF